MIKLKKAFALFFICNGVFSIAQTNNNELEQEKIEVNKKLYVIPQDSIVLLNYETLLLNKSTEYDFGTNTKGDAIDDELLDENINKIFNAVVFSGSDISTNGSAIGFAQNDEKQIASVSGFAQPWKNNKWFVKFGINASGAKSPFNFFNENNWSNGVGGNIGVIYKPKNSSLNFSDSDAEKNTIKRLKYIDSLVKVKIGYAKQLKQINIQLDENHKLSKLDINQPNYYTQKDSLIALKKKILKFYKDFKQVLVNDYESLANRETLFFPNPFEVQPTKRDVKANKNAQKLIKEELTTFDKKNDITSGYKLHWFDADLSFSNKTFSFEKEKIDSTLYANLNDSLDFNKTQIKLNIGLQVGYHHTSKSDNLLFYLNIRKELYLGSFLGANLINGTPQIDENQNIKDESDKDYFPIKGSFNAIEKNMTYGSFKLYSALFFGSTQKVGFNINLSHNYLIQKPDDVFYKNNFTALIGPIFKATGKDDKGVILGIDVGFDNSIYNTKIKNDFTARLRLGIPFKIYTKNKTTINKKS